MNFIILLPILNQPFFHVLKDFYIVHDLTDAIFVFF